MFTNLADTSAARAPNASFIHSLNRSMSQTVLSTKRRKVQWRTAMSPNKPITKIATSTEEMIKYEKLNHYERANLEKYQVVLS